MKIKLIVILALFLFAGSITVMSQEMNPLKVGDNAPEFSAPDDTNQEWKMSDYIGKKNIVIFFYPAAMTGGCTKQACAYRDDFENLEGVDAIVVGISGDDVKNLELFKKAHDLNFPLLSDMDGNIASKYGVPVGDGGSITRELEGVEYELQRGVTASRWTFLINIEGKISYINQNVDAANDSKNVLEVLNKLN